LRTVEVGDVRIGGGELTLIAGPCVVESEEKALRAAKRLKEICAEAGVPLVYKSSFDKANRSSIQSFRGPGREEGLNILAKVGRDTGLPVLSDVHSIDDVETAADRLDALQIPAFLCRQTDLLLAAAKTGRPVNVKKGQFLAPWDVGNVVEKLESAGASGILLTERGTSFGYNNLVADMRSLVLLREYDWPVVFDVSHSVQLPGGEGTASGGDRKFIPHLARAAAAVGVDALFIECHEDPDNALSDGPNMIPLADLPDLLQTVKKIHEQVREGL